MPEGDTIAYTANRIRPVLEARIPDEIRTTCLTPGTCLAAASSNDLGFPPNTREHTGKTS